MANDYYNLTIKGFSDGRYWVEYWDSDKEPPPKIVRRYFETEADATAFYENLLHDK